MISNERCRTAERHPPGPDRHASTSSQLISWFVFDVADTAAARRLAISSRCFVPPKRKRSLLSDEMLLERRRSVNQPRPWTATKLSNGGETSRTVVRGLFRTAMWQNEDVKLDSDAVFVRWQEWRDVDWLQSRSQHLTSSGSHLSDDGNRRHRTVRACRCNASDTVIVTGCGCCTYVHSIAVTGWQLLWTCFFYRLVTCCYWSLTGAVDHLQGAPKN